NQNPKGVTLFNKYQQLYSATQQTDDIDIIEFNSLIDVIPADPRLSTESTDKLPSTNNILTLIHITEPTRHRRRTLMPSSG
ncbi:hypothetical protein ACVGW1_04610, partial [Enterobacter intestinihominis]